MSPARQQQPAPVLLVDVMDTLVSEPFYGELPAFFGMTFEELLAAKEPRTWIDFELGTMEEAEFTRRFFRDRRAVDGAALRNHMQQSYRWLDGMEALMVELHAAGHEMHALSNYPAWWELIEEKLRLSRFLQWSFVSCLTGVRKPDPEAFHGAAHALGRPTGECLFIDDRPGNVEAAEAAGMRALLRTDTPGLRTELVGLGLLPG
jgi:HAD superfamily hydrolase (TIGR01509 family)